MTSLEQNSADHVATAAPMEPDSVFVKKKSLLHRVLTGIGAALFVIVMIFIPSGKVAGLPFALAVAILSLIAASEFYRAVRRQGAEPNEPLGFIACLLFQLAAWDRGSSTLDPFLPALLTLLVLVTMLIELAKPKQKPILNMGATLLGSIYCGWLLSFTVLLHNSNMLVRAPIHGTLPGEWLVLFVIACTSFNDVGGLFVGSAFGKTKLAPLISPGKTWEGAFGGVVFAAGLGTALGAWIHMPLVTAAALGAVLAVVGLVGDLSESALKRDLGVKDFGVLLPGHGGVLDRIDSVLFTAPVAYYLCLLIERFIH